MIAALLPQMIRNEYYMTIACQILIYLIAVCGLNFITGLTGQMNLGTAGMFAMGAYVSGLLNVKLGVSPWLGLVAALCVGWLIGKALGYPSLRLRGVYLSLTTIAFTEIIRMLLNNMKGVTNGAQGLRGIERYNFFGYRIEGTIPYYYMVLIVAILVVWFAWRIVNSKWGREFKAVRDNIDAVESCGIDVAKVKIRAFTLAAMLGSFAGALYAHLIGYINPESFTVDLSTNFVIMLMVGGIGSVFGNVIGAVIITLLPELLPFPRQVLLFRLLHGRSAVRALPAEGHRLAGGSDPRKVEQAARPQGRRTGYGEGRYADATTLRIEHLVKRFEGLVAVK